jgi:hypothetical protein
MTTSENASLPVVEGTGERTERHQRMAELVGWWDVEKVNYLVGPSPEEPAQGRGLVARKRWLEGSGQRFVEDTTSGEFADQPYFRHGVLGYLIVDDRYEWNTVDGMNSVMMTYKGVPGSGQDAVISMIGEFSDEFGLFGPGSRGATVGQRTTITIEGANRHVIDIYFTPFGGQEVLADHGEYIRRPEKN